MRTKEMLENFKIHMVLKVQVENLPCLFNNLVETKVLRKTKKAESNISGFM